ncbi:monocarboxylate transporter 12-like isoform X2 [Acanthaster planci]|uniref:Monocarboxylate transporter 12-like isoform X2 n=1 Tax=Acanthaster planci TaxID=133434 RepID=A0A8B7XK81_ACAPL|nr:monocarboxylate transporter 12-like isoform X2 [Acanthaster planci]
MGHQTSSTLVRHQRWYAVLCLHVSWLVGVSLFKGLGVMLPSLTDQFSAETWMVGWMVAIVAGVAGLTGPLTGPLVALIGPRTAVMASGLALGTSMALSSVATSVVQMALILSLVAGPALVVPVILTRTLVGNHFTENYAIANGIASSGSSVGLVFVAPFTQLLLDTYGWRGTMLLLGGLCMHLAVCGALLQSSPISETSKHTYEELSRESEQLLGRKVSGKKKTSCFQAILATLAHQLGCSVCLRASFWLATVVLICFRFVPSLWLVYFVSQAQSMGFSAYDATIFTTAAGVGNSVIKISLGLAVDRGFLSLRWALLLSILGAAGTLLSSSWMKAYWLMMVDAFFHYGFVGVVSSLCDIYTRELVGIDNLGSALSWMELMAAILQLAFGFFPGKAGKLLNPLQQVYLFAIVLIIDVYRTGLNYLFLHGQWNHRRKLDIRRDR